MYHKRAKELHPPWHQWLQLRPKSNNSSKGKVMRAPLVRIFHTNLGLDAALGRRLVKRGATSVESAGWEQKREKKKENQNELLG